MKGFTLIEILIVMIAIITLIGIIFYLINPVEIFKKNRDFQRINDLKNLELAINTYLLTNPYADLDGDYNSTGYDEAFSSIFISIPYDKELIPLATITDANGKIWNIVQNSPSTTFKAINGLGWIPINFTGIKTPPITYLPTDPINSYSSGFFYTYAFSRGTREFELNANLEFLQYKYGGSQDKTSKDGGSDNEIYEAGTNKCLIKGNKLYGEITTTTCKQLAILSLPRSYQTDLNFACTNPTKITEGIWVLFDNNDNLVPTNTVAVHDGNISTSLYIQSSYYVVHKLNKPYYISYVKLNSDYSAIGGGPYIKYYKNATWVEAGYNNVRDCSYTATVPINTTTQIWGVGWGGASSTSICEMEAYGCPIDTGIWVTTFGLDIIPYDIKISYEKFENFYIIAGAKKINSTTTLPWWAKIDISGNLIASSTINLPNATFSAFYSSLPVDINGDTYVDSYIFGGKSDDTALAARISSTGTLVWVATSSLRNYSLIKSLERVGPTEYIGVGWAMDGGYVFKLHGPWIDNIKITQSSNCNYTPLILNDIKAYNYNEFIVVGFTNFSQWIGKINSDGSVLSCTSPSADITKALYILRSLYENIFYILAKKVVRSEHFRTYELKYVILPINPVNLTVPSGKDIIELPYGGDDILNSLIEDYNNFYMGGYFAFRETPQRTVTGNVIIQSKKYSPPIGTAFHRIYPGAFINKIINAIDKNFVVIGYHINRYGGFIMKLNENLECPNCLSLVERVNSFSNIFIIFQSILQNLRFLP